MRSRGAWLAWALLVTALAPLVLGHESTGGGRSRAYVAVIAAWALAALGAWVVALGPAPPRDAASLAVRRFVAVPAALVALALGAGGTAVFVLPLSTAAWRAVEAASFAVVAAAHAGLLLRADACSRARSGLLAARVAALAAGLAIALLAGEVAVRAFALDRPDEPWPAGMFRASATRGYELAPSLDGAFRRSFDGRPGRTHAVRTNRLGLMGPEVEPKRAGCVRVVVLGDSFTQGIEVEAGESYPRVLERLLRAHHPASCLDVVNAGVLGYSTLGELALLRDLGPALHPDVVVVGLWLGNDPIDNALEEAHGAPSAPRIRPPSACTHVSRLRCLVLDRIAGTLRSRKTFADKLPRTLPRPHPHHADVTIDELGATLEEPWLPMGYPLFLADEPAAVTRAWQATGRALAAIDAEARRLGASATLVAAIPTRIQVGDRESWGDFVACYDPRATGAFDRLRPQKCLAEVCAAAGLEVVDLLPALEREHRAAPDAHLFYDVDLHFNARAHRIAAETLAAALEPRLATRDAARTRHPEPRGVVRDHPR